ncbi:hypothetical protein UlMin_018006 [Ulmus minor]
MTLTTRSAFILLHLFLCSLLLGTYKVSHARQSDIDCLKSIKETFVDPFNSLNSWNFDNNTEGFMCKFVGVECWHPDENKVINIRLPDMGLEGKFPRGIANCSSLTGLDLSNNQLSGTIPSDIARLIPFVTTLDLSNNKFSGEIPKSLSNCTYLNFLYLDHNQLSGTLPVELTLLSRFQHFRVAKNLLSGEVPNFTRAILKRENFAKNPGLCGGPLKPCLQKHIGKLKDPFKNSFKFGFGAGYVVSVIAVILCCSVPWLQLKQTATMMLLRLEKLVNRISFMELCKATDNFREDNIIGVGRIGTTYKATLPNGWFLAVKRLNDSDQFESQFVSELLALSRLRHDNLIPLLGFCKERNEKLLVYKYMSNGNLYDRLHLVQGVTKILEWPLRVKIAIGIARGLAYLHHKCTFRVVHRNINSKCILLDRYFEPKISNFGSTIMSNHGGAMFVYSNDTDSGLLVNSETWDSDFAQKDVYDYGILLLELITGEETVSSSSSRLHKTLVEWINHICGGGSCTFNDAIDKSLIGQGFDVEILRVLRIASECVHPFPFQRPKMLQVYETISTLGVRYGIPCDSGTLMQQRHS